eukprot:2026858-Amphidinium_carterae.2
MIPTGPTKLCKEERSLSPVSSGALMVDMQLVKNHASNVNSNQFRPAKVHQLGCNLQNKLKTSQHLAQVWYGALLFKP